MKGLSIKCMAIVAMGAILGGGCTRAAEEFARQADLLHLRREIVDGSGFRHVVYSKPGNSANTLHVYIDGDGMPWIAGRPADDPTPRNPMMLRLMKLDPAPAVYLGRPCYHGMQSMGACPNRFWLSHRYGEAVVASLSAAIKQLLRQRNYRNIALFGHSGGGALAVLLASRLAETVAVVTVAANLDLEAWAVYTASDDLKGSLNPAALAPLDPSIRQYHFAGAGDNVVPPVLMANAARRLGSRLTIIENFDHACCWERLWTSILADAAE